MKPEPDQNSVVIFTGAGVSAESGIPTFRAADGIWARYDLKQVATVEAWETAPERVLNFYNEQKRHIWDTDPNAAHLAIAELEQKFSVTVITQNIDLLHEKAGSTNVLHVHGQINLARSTIDKTVKYDIGEKPILMGDLCGKGGQLRPDLVLFGEDIEHYDLACEHLRKAGKVLVVGSSLSVFPAANLLNKARYHAEKFIVSYEINKKPYGYRWLRGNSSYLVPRIIEYWMSGQQSF